MFDHTHYLPILKGRAAEFGALGEISEAERASLTPLIEIVRVPWDFENNRAKVGNDAHVGNAVQRLHNAWGEDRRAFIDLLWLDPAARCADDEHPLAFALRRGEELGSQLVPVVGLDRDDAYRAAARDGHRGQGVALRLRSTDLAQATATEDINALLAEIGLGRDDVDLVVDLKELNADAADFNVIGAMGVIGALDDPTSWRSLTLAGGSFPAALTDMKPSSTERYPRAEWAVWLAVRARLRERRPTFGDYAIGNPDIGTEIDPRLMRISAQLRYTTDTEWLVFKAKNIRDYGNEQFIDICRDLASRPEFSGPDFSWGDTYIAARADRSDSRPGNPQMWRKVGTSHHLAKAVSQIASLGA